MNQELKVPEQVAIHPLVLLSVVDHYNRVVQKNRNKRVVGVILGRQTQGKIEVTNSYALPFEEDLKEGGIWYVDHGYHETMYTMFRKINQSEYIVGWYTSGTRYKSHDIEINELFRRYCQNPVVMIIDVEHTSELALPTECFQAIEEVTKEGKVIKKFQSISSTVEASEPEEIGVEHLLREIKDISINSLTNSIQQKVLSLRGMIGNIVMINNYLNKVYSGKIQPNNQILYNIQLLLNLIPNLDEEDLMNAFKAKNNDMVFMIYICSLTRSLVSLHTLINNKISNREIEQQQEKEKEKEKENKNKGEQETEQKQQDEKAKK